MARERRLCMSSETVFCLLDKLAGAHASIDLGRTGEECARDALLVESNGWATFLISFLSLVYVCFSFSYLIDCNLRV